MSDEHVTELLERAVEGVPPALLRPPHAAIRRLVRRRGAVRWGTATVAVLAVMAGLATVRPAAERHPVPAESAVAPTLPTVPGVPWHTARVDRTGTRITVYAAPLPGKCVDRDPDHDRIDRTPQTVSVFLAGTYTGCADDGVAATRTFELPQTVGDWAVQDVREPGGQRVVFHDRELPDLAAGGWTEQPARWESPGAGVLVLRFTRPGGPELRIHAYRCGCEGGTVPPGDRVLVIGGHRVDRYDGPGGPSAGWWSVRGWVRFTLLVGGRPIENSEFEEIIRGMTWA
jgi:hypothetical protein